MIGIQTKIIRHAKKQENMIHNEDNNEWKGTDPELTQNLWMRTLKELLQLYSVCLKVKETLVSFKTLKNPSGISRNENYNVWNEKYAGINGWLNTAEEKMNEFEDIASRNYPKWNTERDKNNNH